MNPLTTWAAILAFCGFVVLGAGQSHAQSDPGLQYGQIPSAAQWNGYFAAKTDYPLKPYTVSTLPACGGANQGALLMVTDATTPTYNGALTGSGAVKVPVFCNGVSWTSH